jgi:hypothetical protein
MEAAWGDGNASGYPFDRRWGRFRTLSDLVCLLVFGVPEMKTMRSALLIAGLSLSVSIGPQSALAQTPPTPEQREARFVAADANKDGKLDKAEWTSTLPERAAEFADMIWPQIDEDGDGSVTKEQFLAFRMRRGG